MQNIWEKDLEYIEKTCLWYNMYALFCLYYHSVIVQLLFASKYMILIILHTSLISYTGRNNIIIRSQYHVFDHQHFAKHLQKGRRFIVEFIDVWSFLSWYKCGTVFSGALIEAQCLKVIVFYDRELWYGRDECINTHSNS